MSELRERVADLVRYNKDASAIAEEAVALIRAETLEEAAVEVERVFGKHVVAAAIRALKDRA